jgi:CubicO group peptidase (beta-lactamase class C family)
MGTIVHGTTDTRFAALRDAFAANIADGLEHGGAFAVVAHGRVVADLWGGHADAAGARPWARDTLVNVWSTTKGVVALAIAMLVERGKLDYAAPVARYWPEFAANGKDEITLDCLMSHRAGLPGASEPMTLDDLYAWTPYVASLGAMAPLWRPGTMCAYHAISYGHLAGEVLRRVDGRSIGTFIAEEIAGPSSAAFFVGLPQSEDGRVATMIADPGAYDTIDQARDRPLARVAYLNPPVTPTQPNQRTWRAAEVPGGNGHGNALGLARIYGALAGDGAVADVRLIGRDALSAATTERFAGTESGMGWPIRFAAGFMLNDGGLYGPARNTFGHTGWGGSSAFADPEAGLGVAYVTNRMLGSGDAPDPRRQRLLQALYDCL